MSQEKSPKLKKEIKLFTNIQIIILATIVFAIIMIFFDNNNVQVKAVLKDKISSLQRERDSLLDQIKIDSTIIDGIENNNEFLERYARENFYMRREGEELYITETK